MCGIAGIVSSNNKNIDKELVHKMTDLLYHRGPDGYGFHFDEGIGFGHRRLSIIDIDGGHQPMSDSEKTIWVTYNGEIYNFKLLREQLKAKGHRFRTDCDTEVIIYAYKEWGKNAFLRFDGMFAFGLWDQKKKKLLLVRDRMGVKPLYWSKIEDSIYFASEVKSILASPKLQRNPNLDAISSYLTFRQPIWDLSFFNGIDKLLPGHYLEFENGQEKIKKYYELPINENQEDLGKNYYIDKVEEMLEKSVKNRMISDVPIGAYLSGGLDSSILVAMMSNHSKSKVKTFSIGYDQDDYNEEKFARVVSKHCKTDHKQIIISKKDYIDDWVKLIKQKDAPLSIPHEVPLYKMSIELKKHVTVVLSGEGADELFGGYGRVQRSPMDWKKIKYFKYLFGPSFSKILVKRSSKDSIFQNLRFNNHMDHFLSVYNWVPFEQKWNLFSDEVLSELQKDKKVLQIVDEIFFKTQHIDPYDRVLHFFEKIHLYCLLDRLDMMSMAASVEARVPFVDDHNLVDFVTKIPFHHKMEWNSKFQKMRALFLSSFNASEVLDTNKAILRKIGSTMLPNNIAYRKKLGFPTPLDNWFKTGMIDYAKEILLDPISINRNLFNNNKMEKFLKLNEKLPYDFYGKKVWMLMNIELWYRNFIDN